MINFRVVNSGVNCAVPIDEPLLLTSYYQAQELQEYLVPKVVCHQTE